MLSLAFVVLSLATVRVGSLRKKHVKRFAGLRRQ